MYKKFYICISDCTQQYTLPFNIYKNSISQKWAREIAKGYNLYERNRFKSWKIEPRKEEKIISCINKQIDKINKFFKGYIDVYMDKGTSQETLNYLHKCFELVRGDINKGTHDFINAPDDVKSAIENPNIHIHEYEDFLSSKPSPIFPDHPFASIVGTFNDRPRYRLSEEDYDHFIFSWKFGEVYINYCEVGKPVLDVFKDNDHLVGKKNIKPLHYYSADFMIKFGPDIPKKFVDQRRTGINEWLKEQDISYSKYLSIGLIPVAKLHLDNLGLLDNKDIVKKYSNCNSLDRAWVEK